MPLARVHDPADVRVRDYMNVPDAELLRARGLFVAEGRLVVARLLAQRSLRLRSVLLTDAAYAELSGPLSSREDGVPAYVCDLAVMRQITGFNIHRGCLALGERPVAAAPAAIASGASRLIVLEDLADADNVGSVFRSAAALGADGALLSPRCCDPLYRKAIRTSMGAALQLAFARVSDWPQGLRDLRAAGFTMAALTPDPDAADVAEYAAAAPSRLALLVGHEGSGLSPEAVALADARVTIPMAPGVDSLNVATAAAIAMHRLFAAR